MSGASERVDGLLDLVEERDRAASIGWGAYFLLGPLTFWLHTVVAASMLLGKHERTMTDVPDPGARGHEAGPTARMLRRVTARARGASGWLGVARWIVALGLLGAAFVAALPPLVAVSLQMPDTIHQAIASWVFGSYLGDDEMAACLIGAGYLTAVLLLVFLGLFHARIAGHESAVVELRLLAELPAPAEAERVLREHDRRWRRTIALDIAFGLALLCPCFFGAPLLVYPLVLLAPLGRHLRIVACNVTATRLSAA